MSQSSHLLKSQREGILLTAEMLGSEGTAPHSVGRGGVSIVQRRRRRLAWGPEGGGCVERVGMEKGRDRGLEQGGFMKDQVCAAPL